MMAAPLALVITSTDAILLGLTVGATSVAIVEAIRRARTENEHRREQLATRAILYAVLAVVLALVMGFGLMIEEDHREYRQTRDSLEHHYGVRVTELSSKEIKEANYETATQTCTGAPVFTVHGRPVILLHGPGVTCKEREPK